jgi:hypothetical protein
VETYFEITERRASFVAFIETTEIGLRLIVNGLVGPDVPELCESLLTNVTCERAFSSVPSFVRLKFFVSQDGETGMSSAYPQVSKLRKTTAAAGFFAWL